MVENYLKESGDVAEGRKAADAMHPIGHIGEPDDIAYGVVYLASDAQVRDRLENSSSMAATPRNSRRGSRSIVRQNRL